ncbi:MAG: hypothetical protein IKS75_01700 [Clostridiales bacterium]|nr:hypothetical protein [Clostridiales bacterium]
MNKTRSLYKAFSSNLEMPKPNGEKKEKLYTRFGIIAFIGIMIPVSVLVGYVTYALTNLLYEFDGNSYGLLSELDLISAFAMIFCMPLMFSVLFFSSDLSFLTALPISPTSLYTARFWHTFKAENVMTSNVLFAIYIGYFVSVAKNDGIADALNPVAIISAFVGFFGSLLMPLIYCSIIGLLMMMVLRKFKRASIYYNSTLILFVAFVLIFLSSFRRYGSISLMNYLDSLVVGNNSFTAICNVMFPTNFLTTLAIKTHNVLLLIASVAILAALYLASVFIARLTYQKGLFAAAVVSNKKTYRKSSLSFGKHSMFTSLLIKEIRVLTRTMTYRLNCVLANLIWPAVALIFVTMAPQQSFFNMFTAKLEAKDPFSHVLLFAVFIAVAFIASGLNSIASTSFTREGVHIDMLNFLPAPLEKQIKAKILTAILFTFIPVAISITPVAICLGVAIVLPLYILISFVCVVIATMIGVVMDSVSPYTAWSDELSALRGNLNCFFNLAAEMIAALVIGVVSYGLYLLLGSANITLAAVTGILIPVCVLSYIVGLPKARKNIEQLK